MKAISLWQPWATLVALGAKQIETRSWEPPAALIGQRIAIHAAKHWDADSIDLCFEEPFRRVLWAHFCPEQPDFVIDHILSRQLATLPFGAIVATAKLEAVIPTKRIWLQSPTPSGLQIIVREGDYAWISAQEMAFGNYAVGRYAWLFDDIQALPEPIPWRGGQRFFEVDLPERTVV